MIPELTALFDDLPECEQIGSSLECLIEHAPEPVRARLVTELRSWARASAAED